MNSLRQQSGQTIVTESLDSMRSLSKVKIKYHRTYEEVKTYVLAKGDCQYFGYMNKLVSRTSFTRPGGHGWAVQNEWFLDRGFEPGRFTCYI